MYIWATFIIKIPHIVTAIIIKCIVNVEDSEVWWVLSDRYTGYWTDKQSKERMAELLEVQQIRNNPISLNTLMFSLMFRSIINIYYIHI